MPREVRHFIQDIIQAIGVIEMAVADKSFAEFQSDVIVKLAVERAIEIISEASRRIPDDIKASRPDVPWPKIKGIGNVLRHEYHGLSDRIIWGVVVDEIPKLRIAIEAIQRMVGDS